MVENLLGVFQHPRGKVVIADLHHMLVRRAMVVEAIGSRINQLTGTVFLREGGGSVNGGVTLAFTAFAGLAIAAAVFYTTRSRIKSPWFRRKRKNMLTPQQWRTLFTPDGKLRDNGVKFLKKVRTGGVDPSIRAEVWPFLLGVYDLTSTEEERNVIRTRKRKEYEKLRRRCHQLLRQNSEFFKSNENFQTKNDNGTSLPIATDSPNAEDIVTTKETIPTEDGNANSKQITDSTIASSSDSFDSDSSDNPQASQTFDFTESNEDNDADQTSKEDSSPSKTEVQSKPRNSEDFSTWQRIIRLDAIRADGEWIKLFLEQAEVSDADARHAAEFVGLKDYDHLDSPRIFHSARLVAILEAYTIYDPEIGYCQGMSDLLSPIICVIREDYLAFWCFVGFMKKARHNFRLDEVGIRRQLNTVSKIIKYKDMGLYRHLEKLQAEDCFFVYRMVVVLFRRELTIEQTLCLWEVMWADQAAIRAGIGESGWIRIRQWAPPTEDLLLYAIAASVLQRRKQIIERYSSMDEILRECNAMAGHLDVWKLLDDAHGLVVRLHDKIETQL